MGKTKKYVRPGAKKQLDALASVRGVEREDFFASGGKPTDWKGGTAHVFKDRKAEASRRACRQNKRIPE